MSENEHTDRDIPLESLFPNEINAKEVDFATESGFDDDTTAYRCILFVAKKGEQGIYLHLDTDDTDVKRRVRDVVGKVKQYFAQFQDESPISVCIAGSDDDIPLSGEHASAYLDSLRQDPTFRLGDHSVDTGGTFGRLGRLQVEGLAIEKRSILRGQGPSAFLPFE